MMKRKSLFGLFAVAAACSALGQAAATYDNPGLLLAPPQIAPNIDALNFVNHGRFIINFTNNFLTIPTLPPPGGLPPYEMQNALNYSNYFGRFMSCNTGFRFETYDPDLGRRHRASSLYNAGTINSGTVDTTNYFTFNGVIFIGTALFLTID